MMKSTEKAMIRAMCGFKLIEKSISQEFMDMLGLKWSHQPKRVKSNGMGIF